MVQRVIFGPSGAGEQAWDLSLRDGDRRPAVAAILSSVSIRSVPECERVPGRLIQEAHECPSKTPNSLMCARRAARE